MSTAQTPADLADRFYDAFARRDAETMSALYADDGSFTDPVFGRLDAAQARAMWRTLLGRAEDLTAGHHVLESDDQHVRVAWTADYTFAATGRHVHNQVEAQMRVVDGRIVDHRDAFSFWAWSRQALGPVGAVAGWTPFLRARVRSQALSLLGRSTRP